MRRLRPALLAAVAVAALLPVTAPVAAACEPAVAGALEVRAKPGAKVAEPDPEQGATADLLQGVKPSAPSPAGSIRVPTWVHVIARGPSVAEGMLTQQQVDAQVRVLNEAFAGTTGPGAAATAFRFDHVGTTRSVQPAWYDLTYGTKAERDAKTTLRKGGKETLNVYVSGLGGGLLGYAYFPNKGTSDVKWRDGVVVLNDSLPGGSATHYDQGDTLPHEVGHWLGLHHTFKSGCSAAGDRVADTPAQGTYTQGCPVGKDTCLADEGLDPVDNLMDYSYDDCMYAFTRGQAARMDAVWKAYRA